MTLPYFSLKLARIRGLFQGLPLVMFLLSFIVGGATSWAYFSEAKSSDVEPLTVRTIDDEVQKVALAYLPYQERFEQANKLMTKKDCKKALSLYQELLLEEPKSIGVLNNLAVCSMQNGKSDKAREYLERAINTQTSLKVLHDNLTKTYAQLANLSYQKVKKGIDILNKSKYNNSLSPPPPTLLALNTVFGNEYAQLQQKNATKKIILAKSDNPSSMIIIEKPLTLPIETIPAPDPIPKAVLTNKANNEIKIVVLENTVKEDNISKSLLLAKNEAIPPPSKPIKKIAAKKASVEKKVEEKPLPKEKNTKLTAPLNTPEKFKELERTAPLNTPEKFQELESDDEAQERPSSKVKSAAVHRALKDWANAWSSKDMPGYFSAYAANFKASNGKPRNEWHEERIRKIMGKNKIKVELSKIKINQTESNNEVLVSFSQRYRADGIKLSAQKTVRMMLENNRWKILQENVK